MKINVNDLGFEFKFRADENFPAQMTLKIGQFNVKGFCIRKSGYEDYDKVFVLFPPASKAGSNWIKLFWTDDKDEWNTIQSRALEQFKKEHADYIIANTVKENGKGIRAEDIEF